MKVPEPRKLPSGTWFIQLRLGGVSVPVSAASKKECIRQAQLIKAEHRAGKQTIKSKSDKTLQDLMQDYIHSLPASTSPSTIRGYKTIAENRFCDAKGVPAEKIKDWQKIIDADAKRVSAKTIKNAWGFARSSLRAAGIDVPEIKLPQLIQPDKKWLEPDEVKRFVSLAKGNKYEIPMLLAIHGLRRSEILAMTYERIDLKNSTITVHGSAVLNEDSVLVQKQTNKNSSSRRVIPIMIPELSVAIRAVPPEERTGLVYHGNVNTLYTSINRLCKENDLPEVGVHGLRHSFASLAFHLGLTEQATMELGGWSDYNTMRKIYTHLARADRLKSRNKLISFFSDDPKESEGKGETEETEEATGANGT